ncbi:MAG: hypothetical protein IJO32_04425 [Bacilli bacterium]|nr:hypothetical protein [Bacilli bacterium]
MKKYLNLFILFCICLIIGNNVYAEEDLSKATWWIYDHTNFQEQAIISDTEHKYIEYHEEIMVGNYTIDRHTNITNDGKTVDFKGYGTSPHADFLYYPSNNSNEKTFSLNINKTAETQNLWHTFLGFSIFFNTNITGNYNMNNQIINTHAIYFSQDGTYLLEITNLSTRDLHHQYHYNVLNHFMNDSIKNLIKIPNTKILGKFYSIIDSPFNKIKLVVNKNTVKLYAHSTPTYYAEELEDWNLMEWEMNDGSKKKEVNISTISNSYGFGLGTHYNVHACQLKTNFIVTDLSFPVELDLENPVSESNECDNKQYAESNPGKCCTEYPETCMDESPEPEVEEPTCVAESDNFCDCLIKLFIFLGHIMNIIKITVPIIIILMGSIDLIKAIVYQNDDQIQITKKTFIKRLIYGVAVFFVISVVSFLIGLVGGDTNNRCFKCVADVNGEVCNKEHLPKCCRK